MFLSRLNNFTYFLENYQVNLAAGPPAAVIAIVDFSLCLGYNISCFLGINLGPFRKMSKKNQACTYPHLPSSARGSNIGIFLLLTACVIVLYGNSLGNPFIWDDRYLIIENHFIKSFENVFEIFKHHLYYSTAGVSNFWRPLQTLFLMLDYSLWKFNPFGYHLTNIAFHLLCAFFIYLVFAELFKKRSISFLVSLLFLIHPVNSTVVNYISSRADSQVTLFILISIFLFLKYIRRPHRSLYLIGSLCSFVLSLLSKELGVILPLLLLAIIPFISAEGKETRDRDSRKQRPHTAELSLQGKSFLLKTVAPFFIILIIYGIIRSVVLHFSSLSGVNTPSLYIRLLTTAESFVRLIALLLFPLRIHIEKYLPFSSGLFQTSTLFSVIILIAIGIFMYLVRRRSPLCLFGLVWFFVTLLPMANIVPINATIADHWLYLPCCGFFLAVIAGFSDWMSRISAKTLQRTAKLFTIILYCFIVGMFGFLTIKQNTSWRNPVAFYQQVIRYSPGSFRAHNEIGIIYLDQAKYDDAIEEFKKAVAVNPSFDQAYDNLGSAYDMNGDFENSIRAHKKAIEINPRNIKAYNNLGNAYNNANRFDEAVEAYRHALELNPHYKAAYNNLGVVYFKKGMYKQARTCWQKTLEIDPNFKMAQDNLKTLQRLQNR
ncbi:MAG: tetratricopeptide repeat protein [Candidatus Omnitrophota bacterium]|nr:MAG: tetratricopeptide repeat protein [Candidatus Omnitrophota bacterium]